MSRHGVVERILLTTDGTVTTMLEQIVGEPIATAQLSQCVDPLEPYAAALLPHPPSRLLTRTTQLVGTRTNRVYVWATSVYCPDVLPESVRTGLLHTSEPIGKLLRANRIECFREILSIEEAGDAGRAQPRRRYVICIGGSPAVLIEEIFSENCFAMLPVELSAAH